jgi:predicted GNAT family acetyltransferase
MTDTLPTTGLALDDAPSGPPSTIADVWTASVKAQRDVSNPLSREYVLGEEYDRRIKSVESATGIRLSHPLRDQPTDADYLEARDEPEGGWRSPLSLGAVRKKAELRFHRELDRLGQQHPDKADQIRAGVTVWDEAYKRVQQAERTSGEVVARSPLAVPVPGLGPVDPVGVAGSMFGFLHDPINVATMFVGPSGSAAKGILWNASRQAMAGAAQQAIIEPFTQAWRAEAGLDYGIRQAAGNILMAGVASGALDAAGRSTIRALRGIPQSGVPDAPSAPPRVDTAANENEAPLAPAPDAAAPAAGGQPKAPLSGDPLDDLEAAARRLPEDSLPRRAADGDAKAEIELAEKLAPLSDDPDGLRGALGQRRFEVLQADEVAAALDAADRDASLAARLRRLDADEEIGRAAEHVADPEAVPPSRPVIVAEGAPDASREPRASGTTWASEGALRDGSLDPIEAASLIRERPELAADVATTTDTGRGIHALAALSDPGFARVADGTIEPAYAAMIAEAAPATRHAEMIEALAAARPRDMDAARRLVAEMLQAPTDAATGARILGLDEGPVLGGGRIDGPAAVWASEGPTRSAQRTSAPEFDEPTGEAAKLQVERLAPIAERATRIEDLKLSLRAQAGEGPELPRLAAVTVDGKIYTGSNHGEAMVNAVDAVGQDAFDAAYAAYKGDAYNDLEGFVTSSGRYVTRSEAADLVRRSGTDPGQKKLESGNLADLKLSLRKTFADGEGLSGPLRRERRLLIDGSRQSRRQVEADISFFEDVIDRIQAALDGRSIEPAVRDEMLQRAKSMTETVEQLRSELPRFDAPNFPRGKPFAPAKAIQSGDYVVRRAQDERHGAEDGVRKYAIYKSIEDGKKQGRPLGNVTLMERPNGLWEVDMVEVRERHRGKGVAKALYAAVEQDIGHPMQPSGILLADGYAMWKARDPDSVKWHVPFEDYFLSPKRVKTWIEDNEASLISARSRVEQLDGGGSEIYPGERSIVESAVMKAEYELPRLRAAWEKLPPEAKTQPALDAMFRLADGGSLAGTGYAPRFTAAEATIAAELAAAAERTLPRGMGLDVAERLRVSGYELDGYFDRRNNLIAVALDAGDPAATFGHERIHALKSHGLFTPEEWGLLVAEANKLGVRQEMGRELVEAYREQLTPAMVKERLVARGVTTAADAPWPMLREELIAAKLLDPKAERASLERAGLWDEARLQALIDEEGVARLAERWRTGGEVTGRVADLLARVMAFLGRVRNVLAGHGFQTLDDVFRRIDDGEVALREAMRAEDVTAMAAAGEKRLMFAGRKARTADLAALERAEAMEASGTDRTEIWTETGWFKGVDGKWRFEIDDRKAQLTPKYPRSLEMDKDKRLGRVRNIDETGWQANHLYEGLYHPELYNAYRSMGNVGLSFLPKTAPSLTRENLTAWFSGMLDPETQRLKGNIAFNKDLPLQEAEIAVLHEIQHAVQTEEGFAAGGRVAGTGRAAFDRYNRLAGEVEARAVEARAKLTPEQRRARPPWLDYDVPEAQQIVMGDPAPAAALRRAMDAADAEADEGALVAACKLG